MSETGSIAHASRQGRMTRAMAALHANCASVRASFAASLAPKTPEQARIVAEQITFISKSNRYHGMMMAFAGLVVSFAFSDTISWPRLLGWWLPVAILFGGSIFLMRDDDLPTQDSPPETVAAFARRFTIASVVLTLAWCALVPEFWVPGDSYNHMLLALVIASSMACAVTVNSAHYAAGRITLSIYGLTLTLSPLLSAPNVNVYFVLTALTYWMIIQFQLDTNYSMIRRMLSLQDERTGLINDLKLAKHESDEARERAEAANLAKSHFLANMSHELRTPLNAIMGFSEMITSGVAAKNQERTLEYAKLIYDSGDHLLALINDILDLSKIEAGRLELRDSEVDLGAVLGDCVQLMAQKAQAAAVVLRRAFAPDLPPVRGDERALRQIMLNLLANALKFTPPDGQVTAFAAYESSGSVCFGVRDTGIGIAEEDLARVFEKFGQGRHDVATIEKGTGLGLAIVRGLVTAHGGEVMLASRVGEGTSVTVRLPRERCGTPIARSAAE